MPWLQDTPDAHVAQSWGAAYRDVQILDSQNRLFGVYNLSAHDLSNEASRTELKQLLLGAARAIDSDTDRLPDDWEQHHFSSLSAASADDKDADRLNAFTEFAFGTNPNDSNSRVAIVSSLTMQGGQRTVALQFKRRAGAVLDYVVEISPDLKQWTPLTVQPGKLLFDGAGTSLVTHALPAPSNTGSQFVRVRAAPRSSL